MANLNVSLESAVVMSDSAVRNPGFSRSGAALHSREQDEPARWVPQVRSSPCKVAAEVEAHVTAAKAFSETQREILTQLHSGLERMHELAALASELPELHRAICQEEFRQLAVCMGILATKAWHGVALFEGGNFAVNLENDGNRLIMAGVDLERDTFVPAMASDISTSAQAASAAGRVGSALRRVVVGQSIVAGNLARLDLIGKRLDAVKAALCGERRTRANDAAAPTPSDNLPAEPQPLATSSGPVHQAA